MKQTQHATLAISILLLSLAQFGITSISAVLPEIANDLSVTEASAGLIVSGFLVAYGVSQLFFAPLSDRIGRLAVIQVGIALIIVGCAVGILAESYSTLLFGRIVQGVGAGALSSVSKLILRDAYGPDELTRPLSILEIAAAATPAIAPLIGAEIATAYEWRLIFGVNIAYALALSLISFLCLRSPRIVATPFAWSNYWGTIAYRPFLLALAPILAIYSTVLSYTILLPFILEFAIGFSSREIGIAFIIPSLTAFTGGMVTTVFAVKRPVIATIPRIGALALVGAACAAVAAQLSSGHFVFLSSLLIVGAAGAAAFAYGLVFPVMMSRAIANAPFPSVAVAIASCVQLSGSAAINWLLASLPIAPMTLIALAALGTSFVIYACDIAVRKGERGAQ